MFFLGGGAWNRKNPLMYLRPKEEERKRWEVFCGVCFLKSFWFEKKILSDSPDPIKEETVKDVFTDIFNLTINVLFFVLFFQNDTEETEKDDAPGSPASHSGSPHRCFVFVVIMDGCTQLSHINQISMTFIDVRQ